MFDWHSDLESARTAAEGRLLLSFFWAPG